MKVWIDHNLPFTLAAMLRGLKVDAEAMLEIGKAATPDVEWIAQAKNTVVVSSDYNIMRRSAERAALLDGDLTLVLVPQKYASRPAWLAGLLMLAMQEIAIEHQGPGKCFNLKPFKRKTTYLKAASFKR